MVPSAVIYLASGILAILLLFLLFAIVYRWKDKESLALPKYPSIVLTSHDSPLLKQKRLWSPPAKSSEETKSTSKMGRKDRQRSYWFPKRDIKPFLPPVQGEYLQPSLPKENHEKLKGRLKFSFGYGYDMELQRSILTVRLHHGRDYTDYLVNTPIMDTFVKTKLLPSKKQSFTSKLQRRTLNPNYNECYHFDIESSELKSQALCFEIFRLDCVSRNEIFGEVILPFKDVGSNGCDVIQEISMSMNIIDHGDETSLNQNSNKPTSNNDNNVEESSKVREKKRRITMAKNGER